LVFTTSEDRGLPKRRPFLKKQMVMDIYKGKLTAKDAKRSFNNNGAGNGMVSWIIINTSAVIAKLNISIGDVRIMPVDYAVAPGKGSFSIPGIVLQSKENLSIETSQNIDYYITVTPIS
jgi:hypothetical protein